MTKRSHSFDIVLGLLLICLFAGFLLLTLASGAQIYQDISEVMDEQYGARTVMGYVSARVRAFDSDGCVELGELDGVPALMLSEELDGGMYVTYIYCADGSLMELFCEADADLGADAGLAVVALDSMTLDLRDGLLHIVCESGGDVCEQYIAVMSGRAGDPL